MTNPASEAVGIWRAALAAPACNAWLAAIERRYRRVDTADRDYQRESGSLRLAAVDGLDLDGVLAALRASPPGAAIVRRLGAAALCNADQCWVRRQHAPARRPAGHHPHGWHQDGALGHDFSLAPDADGGVLEMLTCWIALQPCGVQAPGLAWIADRGTRLLAPAELAALPAGEAEGAIVAPELEPGDVLLFDGTLLHRTQVDETMARDRTSLELRFFPAPPPPRLRGQRFVTFASAGQATGSKTST